MPPVFRKRRMGEKMYCYVLIREHRHFPPNHSYMIAATPEGVYETSEKAILEARYYADRHKKMQRDDVVIKEYTERLENETVWVFRLWYDCMADDVTSDRFCWVVRRVEVF